MENNVRILEAQILIMIIRPWIFFLIVVYTGFSVWVFSQSLYMLTTICQMVHPGWYLFSKVFWKLANFLQALFGWLSANFIQFHLKMNDWPWKFHVFFCLNSFVQKKKKNFLYLTNSSGKLFQSTQFLQALPYFI